MQLLAKATKADFAGKWALAQSGPTAKSISPFWGNRLAVAVPNVHDLAQVFGPLQGSISPSVSVAHPQNPAGTIAPNAALVDGSAIIAGICFQLASQICAAHRYSKAQ